MPARTCSEMRAEVNRPRPMKASTKPGTALSGGTSAGITKYQRKSWMISGMLRNSSVHASPMKARRLSGRVRRMPISTPVAMATTSARPASDSAVPQACISHAR